MHDVVHSRRALVQRIEGSKYDPLLVLVSIAANTRKPDELRLQAAGIACKYVHAALSSATVATLHKTVDSGAALAELNARLERMAPVVDIVPEKTPEPPVCFSEPEEKATDEQPRQPKLTWFSEHHCRAAGLTAASAAGRAAGRHVG